MRARTILSSCSYRCSSLTIRTGQTPTPRPRATPSATPGVGCRRTSWSWAVLRRTPRGLLWADQTYRRSFRTPARSARESRPPEENRRRFRFRPRQPLQDAERGVQTLTPREFDPRADRAPGTRLRGWRKGRAAREPPGSTPTLLDAAGLPLPEEMQGRSVLPLLR